MSFEITGKHTTATVFANVLDEVTVGQITNLCDQPWAKKVRIMPDAHAGKGCTVGTTMIVGDRICPNLVGVDIGCGVLVAKFKGMVNIPALDVFINENIPSGFSVYDKESDCYKGTDRKPNEVRDILVNLSMDLDGTQLNRALLSVGTLGGGNHFIELDVDNEGYNYLTVHTGSRNLGNIIAKYYQDLAVNDVAETLKLATDALIKAYKGVRLEGLLQESLETLRSIKPPKGLECLTRESGLMALYVADMSSAARYAAINRRVIVEKILNHIDIDGDVEFIDTVHNTISLAKIDGKACMVLRKGAVGAEKDELLTIPINMADGILICKGKGSDEWNKSAPHGAGRLMSRGAAKDAISMDQFKDRMSSVYSTSVTESTLDEAPDAYKPIKTILDNIEDTVEVLNIIKPVYNFKSH